jgi:hypothetical protein
MNSIKFNDDRDDATCMLHVMINILGCYSAQRGGQPHARPGHIIDGVITFASSFWVALQCMVMVSGWGKPLAAQGEKSKEMALGLLVLRFEGRRCSLLLLAPAIQIRKKREREGGKTEWCSLLCIFRRWEWSICHY